MSRWHDQPYRPVRAFILVHLQKTFPKRVDRYPHDGIGMGIEIRPSSKGLSRNCVLLDQVCPVREVLFADILQHPRQVA